MTGKAPKEGKTLDRTTLGTRAACLLSDLKRCGFTAPPPAAPQQAPAAQSPAAEPPPRAARPAPPKPAPQPPVVGVRRTSIFEADLTEVEDAGAGGTVHVLSLGEVVPDDTRWQMQCPRTQGAQMLTLRVGFHASRTVPRGALAGRTFDFWVERLDAPQELGLHGGPLWVGRELKTVGGLLSVGTRVIGRRAGKASSPAALWAALSAAAGSSTRVGNPLAWCGLIHPTVQALFDVAAAPPPQLSLAEIAERAAAVGSRSGGLRGLKEGSSQLRLIGQLGGEAFVQAMKLVSPNEPELVFKQLLQRKEFQLAWLPEQQRAMATKVPCHSPTASPPSPSPPVSHISQSAFWHAQSALTKQMLEHPFVKGFVEMYHKMPNWRAQRKHLSLFAPHFTYEVSPSRPAPAAAAAHSLPAPTPSPELVRLALPSRPLVEAPCDVTYARMWTSRAASLTHPPPRTPHPARRTPHLLHPHSRVPRLATHARQVTRLAFGVSRWKVWSAKVHAGTHGAAANVPPSVTTFRIKPEAASALNAFSNDPSTVQLLADNKGASHHSVALKQAPEYQVMYKQ